MILCIDSGNTRIKWGLCAGSQWLAQGALAQDEAAKLAALREAWPAPAQVMLANVAGEQVSRCLRESLGPWSACIREVHPVAEGGGVVNLYDDPRSLGVDRWCALVGARALKARACLVVMAGTATTIDSLDGAGRFLGGMILPGSELMRRALASGTAGLPLASGRHRPFPRRTADAIASGAIEAQAGAVERAFARLDGNDKCCLLSGGNAAALASALVIPWTLADNLPLEGLRVLAGIA